MLWELVRAEPLMDAFLIWFGRHIARPHAYLNPGTQEMRYYE
jgi:hypothetical protein